MTNGDIIKADGREWRVIGVGAECNGARFVHLASTTNAATQRNGLRPIQVCGWLRDGSLMEHP